MTFRCYVPKKFRDRDLGLINAANAIIGEYDGVPLSLRQLYYQFVARDVFGNTDKNYNKLKALISEARLAGLVSWDAIEDRGRYLQGHITYDSPIDGIKKLREKYKRDLWADQACRVEVHFEKAAMEGVIGAICDELRVNFFATRGYNSQSEQWRAGRRFAGYIQRGQRPIVLHLADHDPSGLDMTRDTIERLDMFAGCPIQVIRVALTMQQIRHYRPPPNPAKVTDSRFVDYQDKYGDESWEMDSLSPASFRTLIAEAVAPWRDDELFKKAEDAEAADLDELDQIITREGGDADAGG